MMHSWEKKKRYRKERESSSLLKYSDVCGENLGGEIVTIVQPQM